MPAPSPPAPGNWFADKINRFHDGHERVKHAVHSYWRQNSILSPRGKLGKIVMSCFYFSLPVTAGYFVVTKIIERSESTVEERFGNRRTIGAASNEPSTNSSFSSYSEKIGAGGWGGGVHLATSDQQTQDVNRINLERFLKKQRKLKEKRERWKAAEAAAAQN